MARIKVSLDPGTVPEAIQPYLKRANVYDNSGHAAKTYLLEGESRAFLKISPKGSLERECKMAEFLHRYKMAPKVIAYASDGDNDFLLTEAVPGEDGTTPRHLEQPERLARVFGESLRMLHSLPTEGCPYSNRTEEMRQDAVKRGIDLSVLGEFSYTPEDRVLIHGDYCLPNIILEQFSLQGFIDLSNGGIGDRHYDLYWGMWTLNYNLKTTRYHGVFLDAYGRSDVDEEGLAYFTKMIQLTE